MHTYLHVTATPYARARFCLDYFLPLLHHSPVPYSEAAGFWRKHSNYYNETHHNFRQAMRAFIDEVNLSLARTRAQPRLSHYSLDATLPGTALLALRAPCATLLQPPTLGVWAE